MVNPPLWGPIRNYRTVVIPDIHYPLHDGKAVECVRKIIKLVKPDELIFLGDIGEFESVSEWQWKRKKKPPVQYRLPLIRKEIADINSFLDSFPKTKKTTVLQGNHDLWLDRFVEEQGCDEFNRYLFKNAIKIKERKWNYLPYGEYYRIGKLYFYHGGHYTQKHHAKAHASLGVNLAYAHMHDRQQWSQRMLDGVHSIWSLGCLKKLDNQSNKFLKGRKANWSTALAIVDFWGSNGHFRLDTVDITAGQTSVWGKHIVAWSYVKVTS